MEEAADAVAGNNAAAAAEPHGKFFKLPDFWVNSVPAWFGIAESQFNIRSVTSQRDKFGLVAAVLPESAGRKVTHLLAAPGDNCYDGLLAALLAANQLTDYQKAERMFSSEPLGDRRPSDLLAELMELVKPGEEKTQLFALLFLRRLPAAVRLQLTEDNTENVRQLAEKADRCTASLHKQNITIAAIAPPEEYADSEGECAHICAVGSGGGARQGKGRHRGGSPRNKQQQQEQEPKSKQNGDNTLCFYHYKYGEQAHKCSNPCSWAGN